MAVLPGVGQAFGATLEDNGNPIALPGGSSFAWSTDGDADQISVSDDTTIATITVPADSSGRDTLTVTAATTAPDGGQVDGSVTVDIVPGVTHTYTVTVGQMTPQQLRGRR